MTHTELFAELDVIPALVVEVDCVGSKASREGDGCDGEVGGGPVVRGHGCWWRERVEPASFTQQDFFDVDYLMAPNCTPPACVRVARGVWRQHNYKKWEGIRAV